MFGRPPPPSLPPSFLLVSLFTCCPPPLLSSFQVSVEHLIKKTRSLLPSVSVTETEPDFPLESLLIKQCCGNWSCKNLRLRHECLNTSDSRLQSRFITVTALIPELVLLTDSNSNSTKLHYSPSLHSHHRNVLKTYQDSLQSFLFLWVRNTK